MSKERDKEGEKSKSGWRSLLSCCISVILRLDSCLAPTIHVIWVPQRSNNSNNESWSVCQSRHRPPVCACNWILRSSWDDDDDDVAELIDNLATSEGTTSCNASRSCCRLVAHCHVACCTELQHVALALIRWCTATVQQCNMHCDLSIICTPSELNISRLQLVPWAWLGIKTYAKWGSKTNTLTNTD